jgi:GNAT superfamily N-acetyltransferase/catechol 2,3-dioxygenase-like lactoylglutathione lyase family enzyme
VTPRARAAAAADLDALVALAVAFRDDRGESEPSEAEYRRAYADLLSDPKSELLLALDGDVPIGFLLSRYRRSSERDGESVEIEDLFVAAAARRAGAGRLLVGRALANAAARGCVAAGLTTNERNPARALYEALGFRAESRRWDGAPALWLSRTLAPEARPVPALVAIDHVQLAMPPGREADARAFYAGALGLREVAKPAELAARGGAWFETAGLRVHLGVEAEFRPARKAHPAFRARALDALVARCRAHGFAAGAIESRGRERRAYVDDPFGNRIELVEVV